MPRISLPFWEGLSLRRHLPCRAGTVSTGFPFLLGRAFIEALRSLLQYEPLTTRFPFLFGGAFIEAAPAATASPFTTIFPFLLGRAFIEAV